MEKDGKADFKYCMVPMCKNTIRTAPDMVYFLKPRDANVRKKCCKAMRRDTVSSLSNLYCCEDHFDVEVLKMDYKQELEDKEKQFKVLQQTLQGMQQQLIEAKKKQLEEESKMKELQAKLKSTDLSKSRHSIDKEIINLDDSESDQLEVSSITESSVENSTQKLTENDARLIGIISAFLNVHPFGAGLDYIWSYVSKIESSCRPSDIELLMSRFPTVFKQELVGIGANIERRWMFNAFSAATQ